MYESQRSGTSAYIIIRAAQNEAYAAEIKILKKESDRRPESRELLKRRRKFLRNSNISRLDPFVDQDGNNRVGGRLHRADLAYKERHPMILPKEHSPAAQKSSPSRPPHHCWCNTSSRLLGRWWSPNVVTVGGH